MRLIQIQRNEKNGHSGKTLAPPPIDYTRQLVDSRWWQITPVVNVAINIAISAAMNVAK
jgi:hypothetical protein